MYPQKLATRLTLFFVAVLTVVLLVIIGLALILEEHGYTGSQDASLRDIAVAASERLQGRTDTATVLDEFSTAATFLQVEDPHGQVTAKSSNLGATRIPYRPHSAGTIRGDGFHTVEYQRQELRFVRHALIDGDTVTGYIIVARAVPATGRRLVDLGSILVGAAGFGLVVGVVAAVILVRREIAPIRALTDEALAARSSGFQVPLVAEGDGSEEARELRQALSRLVEGQRQALSRERTFFADSSHVLRTPLAVLQGALEHLDGAAGPDRERALAQARGAVQVMSQSVSALLLLSRDGPSNPATWEVTDIDELLQPQVEAATAAHPAVHLSSQLAPGLPVAGDRHQLSSLFSSIIENAAQYTPAGGNVRVTAWRDDEDAVVEVADSGPGFSDEDRAQAFDRFYRGRAARTVRPDGSGLGLSIAARIAELHHGQLAIERSDLGGALVRIRLPLIG